MIAIHKTKFRKFLKTFNILKNEADKMEFFKRHLNFNQK